MKVRIESPEMNFPLGDIVI